MAKEGAECLTRTFAIESQTFVLMATSVITDKGIEKMGTKGGMVLGVPGGGYAAIFGPDGRKLSKDMPELQEGLVYADLDMDEVLKSKSFGDTCGHYSRPDMLWLGVNLKEQKVVRSSDD